MVRPPAARAGRSARVPAEAGRVRVDARGAPGNARPGRPRGPPEDPRAAVRARPRRRGRRREGRRAPEGRDDASPAARPRARDVPRARSRGRTGRAGWSGASTSRRERPSSSPSRSRRLPRSPSCSGPEDRSHDEAALPRDSGPRSPPRRWAPPAAAQLESALLSKLRFNLTNPGGKSLAMGGAFSAIADDATAALANPAGLGLISSIEVGVSGKRVNETLGLVDGPLDGDGQPRRRPIRRSDGVAPSASTRARRRRVRGRRRPDLAAARRRADLRREPPVRGRRGGGRLPVHRAARQPVRRNDAPGLPLRVPRVRLGEALEPAPAASLALPRDGAPSDRRRASR